MPPGKMTSEKPSASSSAAGTIGVLPPSTMLAISGTCRGQPRSTTRASSLALARRLDEQHVGAGLAVERGALERALEAFDGDGVGAGDDQRYRARRGRRLPP